MDKNSSGIFGNLLIDNPIFEDIKFECQCLNNFLIREFV